MPQLPENGKKFLAAKPKLKPPAADPMPALKARVTVLESRLAKVLGALEDLQWRFKMWTDEMTKNTDPRIPF